MLIRGASTISAKIPTLCLSRLTGLLARSEKNRQILYIHSAAPDRYTQFLTQCIQVTPAQTRNNDSVYPVKVIQPSFNHLCSH